VSAQATHKNGYPGTVRASSGAQPWVLKTVETGKPRRGGPMSAQGGATRGYERRATLGIGSDRIRKAGKGEAGGKPATPSPLSQ